MSYIFRQQVNLPIGPIGIGEAINIPVTAVGSGFTVDGNGGVLIGTTGLFMATWSVPARFPVGIPAPPNSANFNVVITLNNVNNNTILGRSASNIAELVYPVEEFSEVISGSAIFSVTEANTLIQLVNSSILPIVIPIHPGAGANPIPAGASFTIHRIGAVSDSGSTTPVITTR